ncbi:MAG: hypothetical protein OFPI_27880 [Osedax symbiont Rs2]|nr:MAG: hypothetical protein OFPI_27880 [Osedax symbiont Rs2]
MTTCLFYMLHMQQLAVIPVGTISILLNTDHHFKEHLCH